LNGHAIQDDRPVNATLPPDDWDALSAYLDNQLPPAERAALEARLAAEPALRDAMDGLRAVQGALRELPLLTSPRNLTLTPAQARPVRRVIVFPAVVSGLSAVAAILLIAAGLGILRPAASSLDEGAPIAIAAAPSATVTLPQIAESPAARAGEAAGDLPTEAEENDANTRETAPAEATAANTLEALSTSLPDLAFAAVPSPAQETQGYAEAGLAASQPSAVGGAAGAAADSGVLGAAAQPTNSSELNQQAEAAAPGAQDTTRTKEATATAAPSATQTPQPSATPTKTATMTPTETITPTETAAPAPAPLANQTAAKSAEPAVSGWLLVGLGGLLGIASFWMWRRARRVK